MVDLNAMNLYLLLDQFSIFDTQVKDSHDLAIKWLINNSMRVCPKDSVYDKVIFEYHIVLAIHRMSPISVRNGQKLCSGRMSSYRAFFDNA